MPAVVELSRWGLRFLRAPGPNDHVDPGWVWLGLVSFARRRSSPAHSFNVTVPDEGHDHHIHLVGGPEGTSVRQELSDADVSITAPSPVVLGLATGALDPREAIRSGALRAEGNVEVLEDFPSLFDIQSRDPQGA